VRPPAETGSVPVKRYARVTEPEPVKRAPQYRPTLVDPYRDHLAPRRAAQPAVAITTLLAEIKAQRYQGSMTCSTVTSPKAGSKVTGHPSPHAVWPG